MNITFATLLMVVAAATMLHLSYAHLMDLTGKIATKALIADYGEYPNDTNCLWRM